MSTRSAVERAGRGAAAGLAATAVMSIVMLAANRRGAVRKPPPEHIVEAGLDVADVDRDERQENVLSTLAHFGYGMGAGALFGLFRPGVALVPPLAGTAYGLVLALASYEGWVPAAGILPPLHAQGPGARRTLVVSHLVYGAVLDGLLSGTEAARAPQRTPTVTSSIMQK